MEDDFDTGYDSASEDLTNELNKQKRRVKLYIVIILAGLAFSLIMGIRQLFRKREKKFKYHSDKNTESE